MTLPAVSKHLKVLEHAGLIERGREAQWRPCTLRPEPLREVWGWLERFRELWDANFRQLDGLLASLQTTEPARTRKKK